MNIVLEAKQVVTYWKITKINTILNTHNNMHW